VLSAWKDKLSIWSSQGFCEVFHKVLDPMDFSTNRLVPAFCVLLHTCAIQAELPVKRCLIQVP
jgi:hypothetical protein